MPSVHVVGDISTGKSHAGEHLRCLFPFSVSTNGSAHVTRDDNPTESVVYDEL